MNIFGYGGIWVINDCNIIMSFIINYPFKSKSKLHNYPDTDYDIPNRFETMLCTGTGINILQILFSFYTVVVLNGAIAVLEYILI